MEFGHANLVRRACSKSTRHSTVLKAAEKFEESFPAHFRSSKQVLDDEYRDFRIGGNHQRAYYTRLGVNEVVTTLTNELEPIFLKYGNDG